MQFLTKAECKKWCLNNQISLSSHDTPVLSDTAKKQFEIPEDAGKRIALVKELTEPFRATNKALIWITDWACGHHPSDNISSIGFARPTGVMHCW